MQWLAVPWAQLVQLYPTTYLRSQEKDLYVAFFCKPTSFGDSQVVRTNSTQVLQMNSTQVLHSNSTKVILK